MTTFKPKELALAGLIGAVYAVLAVALLPISFGVYQVRVAEMLTVLPFLTRAAIPGLFVGCLLANIFGGMGWQDIIFGSLLTLVSTIATRLISRLPNQKAARLLAPAPPVVFNAFGVSLYLAPIIGVNYWFSVQMVGLGQLVACYLLGLPLLLLLQKRQGLFK